MTDTELRESVAKLGATVGHLSEALQQQVVSASALATQVKESNERLASDRKVTRILTGLIVAKLITLIILVFVIAGMNETNHALNDCITPTGQCAQRSGRQAQAAFLAVEVVRLQTEIPLAEQKGDTLAADYRRKRLADIEAQINAIRAADNIPPLSTTTTAP
jgi:hypothetical protein